MSISILLLILFSALLHASWNIIVKNGENKLFEAGLNALGGGLGAICIVFFFRLFLRQHGLTWVYPASVISHIIFASQKHTKRLTCLSDIPSCVAVRHC